MAGIPLTLSKSFLLSAIEVNGTVLISFTIVNADPSNGFTGLAFSDPLPAGLAVAADNQLVSDCGGTVTATPGSSSIALASGALAADSSCSMLVAVTGATAGTQVNTTTDLSSTETGPLLGSGATATLEVLQRGLLQKAFAAPSTPVGAPLTLTFTVTDLNSNAPYDNVAWSDTLPAGLAIAATPAVGGTCLTAAGPVTSAASVLAPAGGSTIDVFGLGLAGGGSCTLSVDVVGTVLGTWNNTTSGLTYTYQFGGDEPAAGSGLPASASVDVIGVDLVIAKQHVGSFTQGDVGQQYTITVTNVGNAATSGVVTVTDALPAGLTATAMSGTGWSCSLPTLTCTRGDALGAGLSYPAITLTVDVAADAPASVVNGAQVGGGGNADLTNDAASDPTVIAARSLVEIPTLDGAGLAALALALACAGGVAVRRRRGHQAPSGPA